MSTVVVERSSGRTVRRTVACLVVVLAIAAGIHLLDAAEDDVGGAAPVNPGSVSGAAPRVGAAAPDFEAMDLEGRPVRLSDLRGRPVWLNFWASWCPPCRAEIPDVEAAYRERRDQGLVLLGISVGEDAATVRRYAETTGLSYTVVLDPDGSIAGRYRINGIPAHFFVDADGVVQAAQVSGLGQQAILKRLDTIMPSP